MKKKSLVLPALSSLLLSTAILANTTVSAEENVAPATPETSLAEPVATTSEPMVVDAAPVAAEADETVTILHTNDIHGRIEEGRGVIGMAKLATVVEETRAEGKTLVLDSGDAFQGLPISNSTKGEDMAALMNEIGYDAMAVGNHEFDFSLDQAKKYKETLKFPLLSANTYLNDARLFEALTIIDKDKSVVGDEFVVIGVTTPETSTKTHPNNVNGVVFRDPVTEVTTVISEIEAKAAAENKVYNNYIILAHLGIDATTPVEWQGSTLAQALANNALLAGKKVIVLDGHSHTVHKAEYTGKTTVVYNQTGSYLNNIGKVTLNADKVLSAGVISFEEAKAIKANESIAKSVAEVKAKYDAENAKVVRENNPVELNGDRSNVRVRETNLGNLIADSLWSYGQTGFANKTDLAVTNGGGIRATIAKDKPVTKGDIIAVLPFGNIISQITVKGQQIKGMFDKSLSASLQKNEDGSLKQDENGQLLLEANGGFLHISGAQVLYDVTLEPKDRVLAIKIYDHETEQFLPLDLEKTYYLATNDFLAAGGDGYTMLGGAREEGPSMDTVFADYLKEVDLADYEEVNPQYRYFNFMTDQDSDQDGFTDSQEWEAGTDWTDASDYPEGYSIPETAPIVEDLPEAPLPEGGVPNTAPVVEDLPVLDITMLEKELSSEQKAMLPPVAPKDDKTVAKEVKSTTTPSLSRVAKNHTSQASLPKTGDVQGFVALLGGLVALTGFGLVKKSKKD